MKKARLTRIRRKWLTVLAIHELRKGRGAVTMTMIARHMGLVPSSYVLNILKELLAEERVTHRTAKRPQNGSVHLWDVPELPF